MAVLIWQVNLFEIRQSVYSKKIGKMTLRIVLHLQLIDKDLSCSDGFMPAGPGFLIESIAVLAVGIVACRYLRRHVYLVPQIRVFQRVRRIILSDRGEA